MHRLLQSKGFMKLKRFKILLPVVLVVLLTSMFFESLAQGVMLQHVTIFQEKVALGNGEIAAAEMLSQEVAKRTGEKWAVSGTWPSSGDVIVLKKVSAK